MPNRTPAAPALAEDRYFDSGGVLIRYIDQGHGNPVVLVHSYTSNIEDQWGTSGVLRELSHSYRVIAFDSRGHGKSGKPHDPQAYGPEMAWDVIRLLDHLAIAKAHIIGYSMGAHIVAQLLTLAPHRFLSAVLGGGSGRRNWSVQKEKQAETEANEMERGLLDSQIVRLWPPDETPLTAPQIQLMSAGFLVGKDYRALAAVRRSNKQQVITTEELATVKVPLLGIVGSADPYVADFNELKKLNPELKLITLHGATHVSAPATRGFVHAIRTFLDAHVHDSKMSASAD